MEQGRVFFQTGDTSTSVLGFLEKCMYAIGAHVIHLCPLSSSFGAGLVSQVSETEREDLEESEKIQYWVERLCQTRLEQISSADNEISEVTESCFPLSPLVAFSRTYPRDSRRPDGHQQVSLATLVPIPLPSVHPSQPTSPSSLGTCLYFCLSPE